MRTEQEMFDLILNYAKQDERVRLVGMNGSRANPNVEPDKWQDYDIVFVVTEMAGYLQDDAWLEVFGERVIMQKPEAMQLYEPSLGNWFSYLMLFEDGNRIDLILVPIEELELYLRSDRMFVLLLDKDRRVPDPAPSTDEDYWIKRPSCREFDDCCNEFWWLSTYVAKALARKQLPYANAHLNLMRGELMRMLSWQIGDKNGWKLNLGKDYKYLQKYLTEETWETLLQTCRMDGLEQTQTSMQNCLKLFRHCSQAVGSLLGCQYPDYDDKVSAYLLNVI